MRENLRPWFYLACLVVWVCVGLGPSVLSFSAEQDKLDEKFYANVVVPSPQEIFDGAGRVHESIQKIETWDDYGKALSNVYLYEMYAQKYSRESPWRAEDPQILRNMQMRVDGLRRALGYEMQYLHTRTNKKDASAGVPPEGGFTPEKRMPESAPISRHYWLATWTSWIFAFLILLVRLDATGNSIALELATPWWLALATIFWPVGLFKYPNGDPARQLLRGLRFAAFALTAGMSLSPAVAMAQTKGGKDSKKKSSPWAFSIDARDIRVVGPEPKPDTVVKSMITSPSGWVAIGSLTKSKNAWATTDLFGHTAYNKNGVRIDAVAGITKNSAGATVVPVGTVGGVNKRRWQTVFPFAGYERRLDKPAHHVALVNQTLWKMGKWRVGAETFWKKVSGKPSAWYAGGIVARTIGKKFYGEVVVYRDQPGTWRHRGRLAFAHSW